MAWNEHYVTTGGAGTYAGSTNSATPCSLSTAASTAAAGDRVNIKAGTYANTTTGLSLSGTGGSQTAGIWFRGYNTTIGDIDSDNTLTKPLITFTTGNCTAGGGFCYYSNLSFQGAPSSNLLNAVTNGPSFFDRCRFENTGVNAASSAFGNNIRVTLSRCYFKATSSATNVVTPSGASADFSLVASVITGGGHGVGLAAATCLLVHGCIIYSTGGDGLHIAAQQTYCAITGNTFYSCGSDGVEITGVNTSPMIIADNIFANNTGWGINQSAGTNCGDVIRRNNSFYSNTSGKETGFGDSPSLSEQVETSSPFTSAGTNFALVSGAKAKSNGSPNPGAFENLATTGYADIGAAQSQAGLTQAFFYYVG